MAGFSIEAELAAVRPLRPCAIGRALAELPDDVRAGYEREIFGTRYSAETIRAGLLARSVTLAASTIRTHRLSPCDRCRPQTS